MPTQIKPHRVVTKFTSKYTRDDISGVQDYGSDTTNGVFGQSEIKQTTLDPNYRVKIAARSDATNPYFISRIIHRSPFISANCDGKINFSPSAASFRSDAFGTHFIDVPTRLGIAEPSDPDLEGKAVSRLRAKLRRNTKSMNLLVPIAELRQLRSMIGAVAMSGMRLLEILASYTSGKRYKHQKGDNQVKKLVSDAWLTWSFGIKPMLNDIENLKEAIDEILHSHDRVLRLSSGADKEWVSQHKFTSSACFGAEVDYTLIAKHTLSYRVTAGFDVRLLAGNNYGLDSQFALSFGALPTVMWELLPYSWLLDYFSTMGGYLEDTFVSPAGNTMYCSLNRRYDAEVFVVGTCRSLKGINVKTFSSNVTPGYYRYSTFRRTPLGSLPVPHLRLKTSDEIAKNSVNKLLNLAALASRSVKIKV